MLSKQLVHASAASSSRHKALVKYECRNQSGIALVSSLRSVIGPENSRQFLTQSDAKLKPMAPWSPAFSRPYDNLLVLILRSYWLLKVLYFLLIGCCDVFSFGFMTINREVLYPDEPN